MRLLSRRWLALRYFVSSPAVVAECFTPWGALRAVRRDELSGQYAPDALYEWRIARRDQLRRPRVPVGQTADAGDLPRSEEVNARSGRRSYRGARRAR